MPRATCGHGDFGARPCPWPGCSSGVVGAQLVIPGPERVEYFVRAMDVTRDGRLKLRWVRRECDLDEERAAA